jgi:hypothetical protein
MTATPYVIGLKRYQAGVDDRYNTPTESWLAPVDVPVYSVSPASSVEPFEAGRNAVVTGLQVLAPVGTEIDSKDRVIWDGNEYVIDGEVADWSVSPFNTGLLWDAGIEIKLKRVEG